MMMSSGLNSLIDKVKAVVDGVDALTAEEADLWSVTMGRMSDMREVLLDNMTDTERSAVPHPTLARICVDKTFQLGALCPTCVDLALHCEMHNRVVKVFCNSASCCFCRAALVEGHELPPEPDAVLFLSDFEFKKLRRI